MVSPLEQVLHLGERATPGAPSWLHRTMATALAGGPFLTGGPVLTGEPVLTDWVRTDVRPRLSGLTQPVYAVWGADDQVVPVNAAIRRLREAVPRATVRVLSGVGHQPPVDPATWLADVAGWITHPTRGTTTGTTCGAQPVSTLGVPTPPATRWFLHPGLHLAVALGAAAVALGSRRTRPSTTRSTTP